MPLYGLISDSRMIMWEGPEILSQIMQCLSTKESLYFILIDSLREYFQQFGEVIDCVLMVDNITRNSRYILQFS